MDELILSVAPQKSLIFSSSRFSFDFCYNHFWLRFFFFLLPLVLLSLAFRLFSTLTSYLRTIFVPGDVDQSN